LEEYIYNLLSIEKLYSKGEKGEKREKGKNRTNRILYIPNIYYLFFSLAKKKISAHYMDGILIIACVFLLFMIVGVFCYNLNKNI
jgi:hypothetical protein